LMVGWRITCAQHCTMQNMKVLLLIKRQKHLLKKYQSLEKLVNREICLFGIYLFQRLNQVTSSLCFQQEHTVIQWQVITTVSQSQQSFSLRTVQRKKSSSEKRTKISCKMIYDTINRVNFFLFILENGKI